MDTDVSNRLLDSVSGGEGGMIWDNGIETCIILFVKRYARPVLCMIQDPRGWYTGITMKNGLRREVAGVFRIGNTCTLVADPC